jgi:flagellar biosynthesis/type III secretory pathway protein FliH
VEQNINRFLKGSTSIKEITIEPDLRVSYGGCFIETPTGDIDARLESQFEVIDEVLNRGDEQV